MADFPGQVNTQTSSAASHQGNIKMAVDISFLRTIEAIIMMVEIIVGLLVWPLIASTGYANFSAIGWVMFVSVTFWILTILLFCILLFGVHQRISFVPWPLAIMIYNVVATLLYLTAFITNAAFIGKYRILFHYGQMVAAAVFGFVVTVAYGVSTFFSYMTWKGDGGNAAGSTVPV